jgi:hypothetical protein
MTGEERLRLRLRWSRCMLVSVAFWDLLQAPLVQPNDATQLTSRYEVDQAYLH